MQIVWIIFYTETGRMKKYNIWNKWDPLKVCMLGNNYAPEFFNGIPDKAGDPLKRICEETLEDLEGYKKILQDFGVNVIQCKMDPNERFLDNPQRYPRGPLQPRDNQLILGNRAFSDEYDHPAVHKCLSEYGEYELLPLLTTLTEEEYNHIKGDDYPRYEEYFLNVDTEGFFLPEVWRELKEDYVRGSVITSASSFPLGKRINIGFEQVIDRTTDFYRKYDPEHLFSEVNWLPIEGHSDGNYHPIKPGAILSLYNVQTYSELYPGWDVCYLPDQSWDKVSKFSKLKRKNKGKWWLAGEEDNDEFTNFVETWLQDWVGYVEETVFDVNVLVLDEHHVCVSNPNNEQVNTFLKNHNMEPVYVPWRHRYFWDGGLHCITLDLYREGEQQDYFS